jgi:hypothetical protein
VNGIGKPYLMRAGGSEHHDTQEARIVLSLLETVERDGEQTQRRLPPELAVALGLISAYMRHCVTKGLMKVSEALRDAMRIV